jgi:Domain of unknown function (DUF4440)
MAALVVAGCGASQAPPSPTLLFEAAEAYETAQIAGDAAVLERLIADDYVLVGSDGSRQGKAVFSSMLTD